jgi:adenosylcobinamide-GDP ribazoletransferase
LLGLLAAFQFLTLLPIKRSFTTEQIGRSTVYFPLVGLAIGLVLAGANYVLALVLPAGVVNIILVGLLAFFSGGLHLDGFADTMDGMAGHRTPERRLEIMRDSRIGGIGAISLILLLLSEYVLLNNIPGDLKLFALILAPVLSRWVMVNSIAIYPYARPEGLGRSFKDAVTWRQLTVATLIALAVAVALLGVAGLIVLAACWAVGSLVALYLKSRIRGLTGDTYGAINEIATLTVFLMIVILVYNARGIPLWWT